jgi:hypothetical protein
MINDPVPAALLHLVYDSSGAAVARVGDVPYRWQVADLAPGAGGAITVTGVIEPEVSLATVIRNTASITSTTLEADGADNASDVATTVTVAHPIYLPLIVSTRPDRS